jgi:hypothetical protein
MGIDDPLDALDKQFENEERSTDPVLKRLIDLASVLPLPWQVDKIVQRIIGYLKADRLEKIELTINVIRDELRRHKGRLREIATANKEDAERKFQEWLPLVKDGVERAQRTRANERIVRIGTILAKSLVAIDSPKPDDVEEMMRIAMELSDREVELLAEIVRVQVGMLDPSGRVPRYQAWQSWETGSWGAVPNGQLESVFSKLESFGLVSRIAPPNNLTIMADIASRYSLLRKGVEFVGFVRQK